MKPDLPTLYDVIEHTWPAASLHTENGWMIRDGAGGGKRVAATTRAHARADLSDTQSNLFMIRAGEDDLDAELAQRGYQIVDPVNLYVCDIAALMDVELPKVTAFSIWEPLAIMEEIWAAGGIDAARLKVMLRVKGDKTGILARWNEKPAGTAFAAIHDQICMVHAVEVLPFQRKQGVAGWIMRKAAFWASEQGATHVSVLCTKANVAANRLYSSLGMTIVGEYHYRQMDTSND